VDGEILLYHFSQRNRFWSDSNFFSEANLHPTKLIGQISIIVELDNWKMERMICIEMVDQIGIEFVHTNVNSAFVYQNDCDSK